VHNAVVEMADSDAESDSVDSVGSAAVVVAEAAVGAADVATAHDGGDGMASAATGVAATVG
jgi:hypothetical protein